MYNDILSAMVYNEKQLGEFLAARDEATTLLNEEGVRKRRLSLDEALVLQATSHLFVEEPERQSVYSLELGKFTGLMNGSVVPIMHRFEDQDRLLVSSLESVIPHVQGRPPRRLYTPTPFGETVLAVFQPPSAKL